MSQYVINDTTLTGIGDAIRAKNGTSDLIPVTGLADAITNLPTGGGDIPEEAFIFEGNISYAFSSDVWNWFLDTYKDRIKFKDISTVIYAFYQSTIHNLVMNWEGVYSAGGQMFSNSKVHSIEAFNNFQPITLASFFRQAYYLRELPDNFIDSWNFENFTGTSNNLFNGCYSLRKTPFNLLKKIVDSAPYSSDLYANLFNSCLTIDEIKLPVLSEMELTSNKLNSTCASCGRVKEIIFETNEDGTPKVVNWTNQSFKINSAGYSFDYYRLTDYNAGITKDKEIKNDTTYQALKNDPDCFTYNVNYSRYNHDSAVNTINSLPDTSAYLATAGGTNTLLLTGASGALTEGGAINTLTAEEIAVATAKGWTVSMY